MIPRPHRRGFTLVELLVVMALIMILFGLGVAFLPGVYQNKEVNRASELLQNWLVTARQRAKRDKVPYGIRILPVTAPALADRFQFVVRPEDLTGGTLTATGNAFAIGGGPAMTGVTAGDYLEVNGGLPHRITGAGTLAFAFPTPVTTKDYRIVRQPRVLQGETVLEFPTNVGIDMAQCSKNGLSATPISSTAATPFDVVFSPAGNLTGSSVGSDMIIFYIKTSTVGAPLLVCIYTRTGFVAIHPVDQAQFGNPYSYAIETLSSGM